MRARHLVILLLFAAIPIGLAIALAEGGGTSRSPGLLPVTQVSLDLIGGASSSVLNACGVVHHYAVYPAGATIRFRGTIASSSSVSGSGGWEVKLRLKACSAGAFRSAGQALASLRTGATYKGSLPAPIEGYYFARAEVKDRGALVGRSSKRYFRVQ